MHTSPYRGGPAGSFVPGLRLRGQNANNNAVIPFDLVTDLLFLAFHQYSFALFRWQISFL
jgi:hypothetical protein